MSPNTPSRLQKALEEKGIRPSYQRLKILEYLVASKEHPSVMMVYRSLSTEIPTLSRTTIYNTLNLFAEKGLVLPLPITSDEMRYDGTTTQHHHFICKECGNIFDVGMACPYSTAMEIDGHKIEEIHGHFSGTCRKCREKSGRADSSSS